MGKKKQSKTNKVFRWKRKTLIPDNDDAYFTNPTEKLIVRRAHQATVFGAALLFKGN